MFDVNTGASKCILPEWALFLQSRSNGWLRSLKPSSSGVSLGVIPLDGHSEVLVAQSQPSRQAPG